MVYSTFHPASYSIISLRSRQPVIVTPFSMPVSALAINLMWSVIIPTRVTYLFMFLKICENNNRSSTMQSLSSPKFVARSFIFHLPPPASTGHWVLNEVKTTVYPLMSYKVRLKTSNDGFMACVAFLILQQPYTVKKGSRVSRLQPGCN
jgi:hypothetical protein